ncbi:aspartate--tRNA(Asn) ligase [Candidatus Microgenomates bacterium]|nr:aspartate--tRNA(Asn) ligase [Candidatus Microgenomates bacterium]
MERTLILDCNDKVGEIVTIYGWIQTRRDHGKILFLDVLDRTGLIQVVVSQDTHLRGVSKVTSSAHLGGEISPQDVVCIIGKVNKRPTNLVNKNIPTGEIEISAESIEILSKASELPFDMGGPTLNLELPTLLDWRTLSLRHPKIKAIFKVQEALLSSFRQVCQKLGCTEVVVPTIAASSTEGGAEVFRIEYFEHKAFLTQSPQLYKQMLVPVFERVFTITKAYRAEPSVTTRHLAEVTQMDCEFGFTSFDELMDIYESIAISMVEHVQNSSKLYLKEYGAEEIVYNKIPRLTLREAQEVILKEYGRDNKKEKDLTPQDEQDLCKWAKKKHNSDFITVTHFPTAAKPFYTMPDPKNSEYSLSYDLLFKGIEILSGSQRINDYQQLVESIKSHGMDPKDFEMYLMAFKYGMPPEGGFSFGLERMIMQILGLANIREAALFPRDMERVDIRLNVNIKNKK